MKKILVGMFSLLATLSNAQASFKIENAFFNIEEYRVLCANCSTNFPAGTNADVDYQNRYVYTGSIEINEVDPDTFDLRQTIIPNVTMRMVATGLIADFTMGGNWRMRIKGLSGKRIGSIFDSEYVGGKVRLNAFVNLSGMYAKNSNGIKLLDTEYLLTLGAAIDAVHVKASLSMNPATTTIVSTHTNKDTGRVVREDETLNTILQRTIE